MRAIQAMTPGGPEVLEVVELPTPEPGPGELLVAVEAAGVNFIDTYRRGGVYPTPFPHVAGLEGAGIVISVGEGVTEFAVGDKAAWADAPGSYAECAIVRADRAVPVPEQVDPTTACALMLQGMTAHYLARSTHPITAGETVLIHAAAGGVGQLLTQLAVSADARVIGTVSTEAKAQIARQRGADAVIRYDQFADLTQDLPRAVQALTEDEGVAVVYDGVGKATFDASLACLKRRGMLVLFGGASGQVPPFDLQRLNRAGSLYVTRPNLDDYIVNRSELLWRAHELFADTEAGTLAVDIGGTYSLDNAAQAHRDLEARNSSGKLIIRVAE